MPHQALIWGRPVALAYKDESTDKSIEGRCKCTLLRNDGETTFEDVINASAKNTARASTKKTVPEDIASNEDGLRATAEVTVNAIAET